MKRNKYVINLSGTELIINAFLCCFSVFAFINGFHKQQHIAIISVAPFCFSMFLILSGFSKYFIRLPGLGMLLITCAMRYYLMPSLASFMPSDELLPGFIASANLFVYEMLVVLFSIWFFYTPLVKKLNLFPDSIEENKKNIIQYKTNHYLSILIIILAVGSLLANPSYLSKYHFIFSSDDYVKYIYESNWMVFIVDLGKTLLTIISIEFFYVRYVRTGEKRYVFLAYFIGIINAMIMTGLSRGSALVPCMTIMFVLLNAFPKYRKRTMILFGSVLFILVIISTIYKTQATSGTQAFTYRWLYDYLAAYYGSLKNIDVAIQTKLNGSITISTLFNDIIRGIPIINKLGNPLDRTVIYYGYTYYGRAQFDQIVPTIGLGYIYLGYILSPTFSFLLVYIVYRADIRYLRTPTLTNKYLLCFFAVQAGFKIVGDPTGLISLIFQNLLIIYLVFEIEKLCFPKKLVY